MTSGSPSPALPAGDSFWAGFDAGWHERVLARREPAAPYLHMKDVNCRSGIFRSFTNEQINRLIWDALNYLQHLPNEHYCALICSINREERDSLVAEGYTIPEAPTICAEWCITTASRWRVEYHPHAIERISVYFDQGEPFMHEFRQRWLRANPRREPIITDPTLGLIEEVSAADMRNVPALQAADMLAWATSRRHSSPTARPMRLLSNILHRILPYASVTLDGVALRRIYGRQ